MKYVAIGVACLGLGFVLATGSPALAQPPEDAAAGRRFSVKEETAKRALTHRQVLAPDAQDAEPTPRFDVGVSVLARAEPLNRVRERHAVPAGIWFTVGSGRVRLLVDYWQQQERREFEFPLGSGRLYRSIEGNHHIQAAVARHFRTGRRLTPHLLAGIGYIRATQGTGQGVGLVLGGGLDVSVGSRFFVRVQSRGLTITNRGSAAAQWRQALARYLLVGAGVRF